MRILNVFKYLLMLVLLCLWGSTLLAQQDWSWVFGDGVLMRFPSGGAPVVDPSFHARYSLESSASISDDQGNLKYFVIEDWIFRRDCTVVPGGLQLTCADLTNGYLILPIWGDTTDYLMFTLSYLCGAPTLCPWVEEIRGPLGRDSIVSYRNLGEYHPTHSLVEKIAAVRDASGTGWWVLYHGENDNIFIKFKVNGNQISSLSMQAAGSVHGPVGANPFPMLGEMCFSPQGDKLLAVTYTGIVDIFDFDRCSGQLSNGQSLGTPAPNYIGPDTYYGCSFSPDGTKIYVSEDGYDEIGNRLYQWDLTAPNVPASKRLIFTASDSVEIGQHQLGPDGKIYITQIFVDILDPNNPNNLHLAVINDPNQAGLACNFVYQQVYLQGLHSTGNLPNLPNFNLPPLVAQVAEAGPPSVTICPGDSIQIGYPDSTGGAVIYAWTAHPDIADTTLPELWVQPTQSTWYYVMAVDSGFGLPCGKTIDSIHVIIADSSMFPTVGLPPDTTICPGDSIRVSASVSAGIWQYLWLPTGETTTTITVTQAGVYALNVTNPAGIGACFMASDIVVVDTFSVFPGPSPTDTTICLGDSIMFGMALPPSWAGNWQPATGLVEPDSVLTMVFPPISATYILFATDTTNPGGCATLHDTIHITVEIPFVHPAPESQEFCPGEVLIVGVGSVSAFTYAWSPITGLNDPFASSTTVAPETSILYTLAITSDTMVSENCKTQYFPVALTTDACIDQNVVTPNGDGINDFLRLGSFNGPISLSVYDRWGALVFSSSDYRGDWPRQDGRLPESVYWYVVKVAAEGGKAHLGEVTVLR
jgi:gliding motility-associated-like protein